jgi:hypothetical protein
VASHDDEFGGNVLDGCNEAVPEPGLTAAAVTMYALAAGHGPPLDRAEARTQERIEVVPSAAKARASAGLFFESQSPPFRRA